MKTNRLQLFARNIACIASLWASIVTAQELTSFSQNGLYGFKDASGKVVIAPQFESVGDFSDGRASAFKGGKLGYIDLHGNTAVPFIYGEGEPFSEGYAV